MPQRWANEPAFSDGCVWHRLPLDEVTFTVDPRWRTRDARDSGQHWLRELITHSLTPKPDQRP